MALPLPLRNRLAELILESLHDPTTRSALEALVRYGSQPEGSPAPPELTAEFPAALRAEHRRFRIELCDRARRAWDVVRERPLAPAEPSLAEALNQAADLFDAGLFFEVHELLEPYWIRAEGATREALRGVIQVSVGFQHLANGNVEGASMLLEEGGARMAEKKLEGRDLDRFVTAVGALLHSVAALDQDAARTFDWTRVPRFPRGG